MDELDLLIADQLATIGELSIAYDRRILEPRPWTVMQSEWATELADFVPPGPMLEVCSGAGHIGLIAAKRTGRRLVQIDADPIACTFARANAARALLSDHVEVRCARIDEVTGSRDRYPLVIADPPYIATDRVGQFPEDPLVAIDGGVDGLDLVRACIELSRTVLMPGGRALIQLGGAHQLDAVAEFAAPDLDLIAHRSAGPTRFVALFAPAP